MLESKGEKITFVGDIIHVAAVQFPQPDVTIAYDEDQDGAARVRKQAFDDFVKTEIWLPRHTCRSPVSVMSPKANARAMPGSGYLYQPGRQHS